MSSLIKKSAPFDVTLEDGSKQSIQVATRLSISARYQFAEHLAQDRSIEAIKLCTGKSEDWLEELATAEVARLAAECFKRNFKDAIALLGDPVMAMRLLPFMGRLESLLKLAGDLPPELQEQIRRLAGEASSDSSSAPAPSTSATETSSESATPSTSSGSKLSSPPA
jgi:hypothetical protein